MGYRYQGAKITDEEADLLKQAQGINGAPMYKTAIQTQAANMTPESVATEHGQERQNMLNGATNAGGRQSYYDWEAAHDPTWANKNYRVSPVDAAKVKTAGYQMVNGDSSNTPLLAKLEAAYGGNWAKGEGDPTLAWKIKDTAGGSTGNPLVDALSGGADWLSRNVLHQGNFGLDQWYNATFNHMADLDPNALISQYGADVPGFLNGIDVTKNSTDVSPMATTAQQTAAQSLPSNYGYNPYQQAQNPYTYTPVQSSYKQ